MSDNSVSFGIKRHDVHCSAPDGINPQSYRPHDGCTDNRELTRLGDDLCAIDCRSYTSQKPIKFVTTNYHNLGCNPQSLCFPGYLPWDGSGWAQCAVDEDSKLRYSKMTNLAAPQQLECLPVPSVPFMGRGCLDTDTEMNLRGIDTSGKKTCLPKDTVFHNRHFDYFDHLCYQPNSVKNTVWQGYQTGVDTRHQRVEPYRNGGENCAQGPNNLNPRNYSYSSGNMGLLGPYRNTNYDASKQQGNFGNSGFIQGVKNLLGFSPSCKNSKCFCQNCTCGENCTCNGNGNQSCGCK